MASVGRGCSALVVAILMLSCSERHHFLGYNLLTHDGGENTTDSLDPSVRFDASTSPSGAKAEAGLAGSDASDANSPNGIDGGFWVADAGDQDSSVAPKPPIDAVVSNPPNVLVEVLAIPPMQVEQRVNALFEQLFYGDPSSEAVYFEVADDGAYIFDVLHDDTRMDAMGYAMMITAQLGKEAEFRRLWNTVEQTFRYASGPREGYYRFSCDTELAVCDDTIDTFGTFYVITSLFIAGQRFDSGGEYALAAERILDVMRSKEDGQVVGGVLNIFGATDLPSHVPLEGEQQLLASGDLMPGFFQLWAYRTGDPYWQRVARKSRELLHVVTDRQTGLAPDTATMTGEPATDDSAFRERSYGAGLQMAVDNSWVGEQPSNVERVNRILGFFVDQGLPSYPSLYAIDGRPLNETTSGALVALNGAAAGIGSIEQRAEFVRAVWEAPFPTGIFRFYDGMNQLLSLLYLSGSLRPGL